MHGTEIVDRYMSEIPAYDSHSRMDRKRELDLIQKAKNGDLLARDELIGAHLHLVVKIANPYTRCGLPMEDMIQEGNLGLIKSIETFKAKHGARLSTWARFWIRQFIRIAISRQTGCVTFKSRDISAVKSAFSSLDQPAQDGEDERTYKEMLRDPHETPDRAAMHDFYSFINYLVLRYLDDRQAHIIRARFGLADNDPKTLIILGKRHHLSPERIRQLQNEAKHILLDAMQKICSQRHGQSTPLSSSRDFIERCA